MRATKMLVAMSLTLIMLMTITASADTGCEAVDTSLNKRPEVVNVNYTIRGTTVYFTALVKDDEFSKGLKEVIWDFGDGNVEKKYGGWAKVNETKVSGSTYYLYELSVSHTYKDYRQYTIEIKVKDIFGLVGTYTSSITVKKSNVPPLVELEDVQPNPAKPGEKVTFLVQASDPDGRVTTFYWDFGDGDKQQGANLTKVTHAYSREGVYTVNVKVVDDKGATSNEASIKVYVKAETITAKIQNRAPIVTSVTLTPQEPAPGNVISFKASAYDPDGDPITTYTWDFGDGTVRKGGAEMKYSYPKEGAYTVKVKVIDSKGLESPYYTVSVAIKGNKPPQASIISIKSSDMVTFLFQGMGVDPDGQVVAYEWRMGDGKTFTGELEGNSIPHRYINYTYSKSGNYTVSFRVRDKEGAWSNWVSERITVKLPEKLASAAVSWLGFDNIWVTAGAGALIVLLASYLSLRDSKRNNFIEKANSSKKIIVKRSQARERRSNSPKYHYRDYRSYARRGSKRTPWD
ncbi:MAG: PKD domain-containing protein [Candidatus Korarchaeum sp.]|nr:PKD domain-containing protein [Candidatus Korarchaeum sp.]MDW8034830.1 PKD domain-containing protein [Candidatus Korarchaeum sp.]